MFLFPPMQKWNQVSLFCVFYGDYLLYRRIVNISYHIFRETCHYLFGNSNMNNMSLKSRKMKLTGGKIYSVKATLSSSVLPFVSVQSCTAPKYYFSICSLICLFLYSYDCFSRFGINVRMSLQALNPSSSNGLAWFTHQRSR